MEDGNHQQPHAPNRPMARDVNLNPSPLLLEFWSLFSTWGIDGPVIDLACGRGHNGIYLATKGIPVVLIDRSAPKLDSARNTAQQAGVEVNIRRLNLEKKNTNPLPVESAGGILVFRYLHRPLMPDIKKALTPGGILIYETYTRDQAKYKRPKNPDYLLKPGELKGWFKEWEIIHDFEGTMQDPERSMAQIVCRKPANTKRGSIDALKKP